MAGAQELDAARRGRRSVFVAMVRGMTAAIGSAPTASPVHARVRVDEHRVHEDHRRRAARAGSSGPTTRPSGSCRSTRSARGTRWWCRAPRSTSGSTPTPELLAHLTAVAHAIGAAVRDVWQPPRVGLMVAGFEVPHLHVHVFPAWDMARVRLRQRRGRRRRRPSRTRHRDTPARRAARRRARRVSVPGRSGPPCSSSSSGTRCRSASHAPDGRADPDA